MENCFILKYYNIKILTNNVSTKLILLQVTVYLLRNLLPFMSFHEKDKGRLMPMLQDVNT